MLGGEIGGQKGQKVPISLQMMFRKYKFPYICCHKMIQMFDPCLTKSIFSSISGHTRGHNGGLKRSHKEDHFSILRSVVVLGITCGILLILDKLGSETLWRLMFALGCMKACSDHRRQIVMFYAFHQHLLGNWNFGPFWPLLIHFDPKESKNEQILEGG